MLKRYILLTLFVCPLLLGGSDLQSKIAKLQTLSKSERFLLMNEIKKELAQMNAEQRKAALGKLRASMHKRGGGKGLHKRAGMHQGKGLRRHSGMGEFRQQHRQKDQVHQEALPRQNQHQTPAVRRPANQNSNQHHQR